MAVTEEALDVERVSVALVDAVVRSRGEGFDWLDDNDRFRIRMAICGQGAVRERIDTVLNIIDAKVTVDAVLEFLRRTT
jgi:hypothetical protein